MKEDKYVAWDTTQHKRSVAAGYFDREKNFKSRLEFVRFWANYVKSHPNDVWSRQQADFINSALRAANQDVELYKKVKGI